MSEILYLNSHESGPEWETVRTCVVEKLIKDATGADCAVVRIDPPIPSSGGWMGPPRERVVLRSRWAGCSVASLPHEDWISVFVLLPHAKSDPLEPGFDPRTLENRAWADVAREAEYLP